ncbi:MlaA family lipoprotein [Lysobacter sp. A289]
MPFQKSINPRLDKDAATLCGPVLALALAVGAVGCASTPAAQPAATPAPTVVTGGVATPAVATDSATVTAVEATAISRPASEEPRPTQAELDFAAIYGQPYDPVADPTLPEPARIRGAYDPWESYNRKMHVFNNFIDRAVARPLARAYVAAVPRPIRLGVSNFFSNLGQPVTAVNALLQGKPAEAAQSLGRFTLNTTLGIGGIFDPASDASLDNRSEDFGQTLGIWGWERSRYVELPLFGPRTIRDVFGMVGDAPLSPLRQVDEDAVRIPLQGLQLVNVRTQLLATDSLRVGVADDYALVRDAWMQRRDYQIFGERMQQNGETSLPDYLLEDDNPIVPVGAMPVMPPGN